MKPRRPPIAQPKRSFATVSEQQDVIMQTSAKFQAALALHRQGRLNEAEIVYKEILQSQAQHFDALQLLATIAVQRKHSRSAVELFDQALKINPNHAASLNNRGVALRDLKLPEQALDSYDKALAIMPDYAEALNNRGAVLRDLRRPEQALDSFDRALAVKPDDAEALNNRGAALRDLKRPEQARGSYDRALAINPGYAEALYNRGNVSLDLKRPEQALNSYDCALVVKPDYAEVLNNRGTALCDLQCPERALESYDRALAIKPDYAGALNNRGNVLVDLKRPVPALDSYDRALAVEPDYAEAHWGESLCRLLLGDFARGWRKYEWRWKREPQIYGLRNFQQPLWLGEEELKGKTILLHSEQGLGDTIQFCRYASQVAELGAKVILEVQPPLQSLLTDLEGVTMVLAHGETLPDFDCHCPLLSLPLAFKADTSTIRNSGYLKSSRQKTEEWESRLTKSAQKRIGLVWSGNKDNIKGLKRSIALHEFMRLVNDRADYYCLQKELRPEDRFILEQTCNVEFFGDEIKDFSDTAALVDLMDLVITVDTSVAHLAGAMGKEVWILLPFSPDWRWLLGRSDSPWYRSAKLFRQPGIGDWKSVVSDLKAALDRVEKASFGETR